MTNPVTVLVVEDEAIIRFNVADQLAEYGFDVVEAANADEAIELLNHNKHIQLVFTDVKMPGSIDGLRLASTVRDRWPPIKIIVTSGHMNVRQKDLPEGSLFFGKPYELDAVVEAMKGMLA